MSTSQSLLDKYAFALEGVESELSSDQPVQIMLMGEFNAGKSSLTNALLGEDLLPVDIFQTTATINRINHSPIEGFRVIGQDGKTIMESTSIKRLSELNADAGSFDNVKWVEIGYPSMPEGIELIDTPGFNDPNPVRDATFLSIVPSAEIVIFVCDANQALKGSEIPYIKKFFSNSLSRSYFVFNHSDTLGSTSKLASLRSSVISDLMTLLKSTEEFYRQFDCVAIAEQTKKINLDEHVFFVSAALALGRATPQPSDSSFTEMLSEAMNSLKIKVYSTANLRDRIREEWQIRSILASLESKYGQLTGRIDSLRQQKSDRIGYESSLSTQLRSSIEQSQNLQAKMDLFPKDVRAFLEEEEARSLDLLRSTVQSFGDDSGGFYIRQAYEEHIKAAIQRLTDGTKDLASKRLEHSFELGVTPTSTEVLGENLPIKSSYSRSESLQKAGITSAIIGTAAFYLLGPLGAIAGTVISGLYQIKALKDQRREMEMGYDQVVMAAKNTMDGVTQEILDATRAMLRKYENDVLMSAQKMQWQLIEFSDQMSRKNAVDVSELNGRLEQLRMGIRECRIQLQTLETDK